MKKEDAYKLGVAQTKFRKRFRRKRRLGKIKSFFLWTGLSIGLLVMIFFLCIRVTTCPDSGMNGSIHEGDLVLTNRLSFLLDEPERGEIITFEAKDDAGVYKMLQRRVIALPGEEVEIVNGTMYINDQLAEESYSSGLTESEVSTINVPQGTYYVLCDERGVGPDSRNGIYVEPRDIAGAVICSFPASPDAALDSITQKIIEKIDSLIG